MGRSTVHVPTMEGRLWAAGDLLALDWSSERCSLAFWVNTSVGLR